MRPLFLVSTLVAFQFILTPLPASAAAAPVDCSTYTNTIAKDLETNTTRVDDLAKPNSPSPDHIAQSAAGYNAREYYSKVCTTPKTAYVDALLTTWRAWLEHATAHVNPLQTTELAAKKLKECSVTYSATEEGTTCANWEKQVTEWQDDWGSP